jgi:hypothetical protein
MRKPTLQVRKNKINGRVVFQVRVPNPNGGLSIRKTFKTKQDAETCASAARIERENYGAAAFGISDALRTDAVRAAEILRETGVTLTEAARAFLKDWQMKRNGVAVAQAVDAFLASRANREKRHLTNLKTRLSHFVAAAGTKNTTDIEPGEISDFLVGLTYEPRTVLHYWTHLNGFFNFCLGRKWVSANPMRQVDRPRVSDADPEKLSTHQAAKILLACDDRILPGVAIALFCGLRQSEVQKLDWDAVDFEEGVIKITASLGGKQSGRRVVPLRPCLKAWLSRLQKKSGRVWPEGEGTRDLWTQARIVAGFGPFKPTSAKALELLKDPKTGKPRKDLIPWPENVLRHSGISYNLATDSNLARVAYESGNSPDVIKKHYNGLATNKEAQAFFAIMPPAQNMIVRMTA